MLSTLYRTVATDVGTPIAEGYEALRLTREMRATLAALEPRIGGHVDYAAMLRSLDYQESLYRVLADFRATFLLYYQWLDRGGDPSAWRTAAARLRESAAEHERLFATDLDFPAFDVSPAVEAAERALQASPRDWARVLALGLALLLALHAGGATRKALPEARHAAWAAGSTALALSVATTSLLAASSWTLALGTGVLLVAYAMALAASWQGSWGGRTGRLQAPGALGPLVWACLFALAAMAVRGPDYFWFLFWTHTAFRTALFSVVLGAGLWTLSKSYRMGLGPSGSRSFAAGSVLIATGCALLVLTVVLPDLEGTLAALDEPLQLLPMRRAIINGVTHYAGVTDIAMRVPGALGGAMMLVGAGLRRLGRR